MQPQAHNGHPPLESLIFSHTSNSLPRALKALSAAKTSLRHRLQSIRRDASFVLLTPSTLSVDDGVPFVANARAGTWYVQPSMISASAYFKSTDGHHLNWSFSTRRLNLHLLPLVGKHSHAIIVDSTRRGKVMPDALSKTVPIWTAVMNRVLFPDMPAAHGLITSRQAVGASEHAQMEERLPEFARSLRDLKLDWDALRMQLGKPMKPVFVSPDMDLPSLDGLAEQWSVLVLVSASRLESGDMDDGYVQGAADDAEHWALGLTPDAFWEHQDYLLDEDVGAAETEARVVEVVGEAKNQASQTQEHDGKHAVANPIHVFPSSPPFYVVPLHQAEKVSPQKVDIRILCCSEPPGVDREPHPTDPTERTSDSLPTLRVHCPPSKLGSRALRVALPGISKFIFQTCQSRQLTHPRILYACAAGNDISVGVALAMACQFQNQEGDFVVPVDHPRPQANGYDGTCEDSEDTYTANRPSVDKTIIRQRLVLIQSQMASEGGGPSRSTLTAVNGFLMGKPEWT